MENPIISAEGLIKEYHVYDRPLDRLNELIFKKKRHRVFRALGPLDVEVRNGESVGIVGENGAGKSTLLKIVAGVIEPSSGSIRVEGRISSILELGTGFNPEFTGRENISLNGALYGFSPAEINDRMERIYAFADIGEFFDMPVKVYSSGMYMRLAFSLSVHVDADIIVIDEALAVGDGAYEKKCIDRIWELKKEGVTILFCSHSVYTVANFCDRAIWLREGVAQLIGESKEVVSRYEDYLAEREAGEKGKRAILEDRQSKKVALIRGISVMSDGRPVEDTVKYSSDLELVLDFEVFEDKDVSLGFAVDRNDGLCCYADTMVRQGMEFFHGPGIFRASILFRRFPLLNGAYKIVVFLLDDTGICVFDRGESNLFKIKTGEKEWGVCNIEHEWKR